MTLKQIRYYAIKKHELMDHRYGGAPYSDHLERVVKTAQLFIEYIDPEEQDNVIGSCWAHDLIEDTLSSIRFFDMHFMKLDHILSFGKRSTTYSCILLRTLLINN